MHYCFAEATPERFTASLSVRSNILHLRCLDLAGDEKWPVESKQLPNATM
jgi:hypothetical protein